jgi:hypothetical protein
VLPHEFEEDEFEEDETAFSPVTNPRRCCSRRFNESIIDSCEASQNKF